jgi:hypothetical protein
MGSINLNWRLNPEVKREAWFYSHTGGVVDDPFWHHLEHQRELEPAAFDAHHRNIAGYFTKPDVVGQQPHGPVLDDLRHRFEVNPERFSKFHKFWGEIFAREPQVVPSVPGVPSTCTPPPCPPVEQHAVPEPSGVALMLPIAVAILARVLKCRRA